MLSRKIEQKIDELERNIDQRFEAQPEMIKSVADDELRSLEERRNKERNRWKGKFWKAYALATNNIIEASKSTDSKRLGRGRTVRYTS